MSNESENKLARRVDDKRAEVPLQWNEPAATSANASQSTKPREVQEYTGLDTIACVLANAADSNGRVLLSSQSCDLLLRALTTPIVAPIAPAVQAQAELTDERIDALWKYSCDIGGDTTQQFVRHFARAIELELRAGGSDVRDQALLDFLDRWVEQNKAAGRHWFTFSFDTMTSAREQIAAEMAEAPAASKKGDAA